MDTAAELQLIEAQCRALDSICRAIEVCCGAGCSADELVRSARLIGERIAANLARITDPD